MGWFLSLMKSVSNIRHAPLWYAALITGIPASRLSVWMCRSILLPTPPPESIFQFLMAVGPPGYTALAYMNLARTARYAFPAAGLFDEEAARIFQIVSIWYSLPLFGLALYLWITPLVLYTIGIIKIRKFQWTMAFWSLTFPSERTAGRAIDIDAEGRRECFALQRPVCSWLVRNWGSSYHRRYSSKLMAGLKASHATDAFCGSLLQDISSLRHLLCRLRLASEYRPDFVQYLGFQHFACGQTHRRLLRISRAASRRSH